MEAGDVRVSAFLVEHGPVKPAYGFRFEGGRAQRCRLGDTRPVREPHPLGAQGRLPHPRMLRGGEDVVEPRLRLADDRGQDQGPGLVHTQPEQIGLVAEESRAKELVMTHLFPVSDPAELCAAARKHYAGPVVVGET